MKNENFETKHYAKRGQTVPWHSGCQCYVEKHQYNRQEHVGYLYVRGLAGDVGAVDVFKAIDPDVRAVVVLSDGQYDTLLKKVDGEWLARDIRKQDQAAA